MEIAQSSSPLPAPEPLPSLRRKWLLRTVIGLAAVTLIAVAGRHYYGELYRLRQTPFWALFAIAALYLLTRWLGALIMARAFNRLGHPVHRVEAFFLLLIQSYVNLLIPRAGMGMPAAYLKLRRGVPISDFSAVQLLPLFLMEMLCVALAGLASLLVLTLAFGHAAPWGVAALFGSVAIFCVGITYFRWPARWTSLGRISAFFHRLSAAYQKVGQRGLLGYAVLSHSATMVLRAIRIWIAFYAIGVPVNVFAASVASLLSDFMIAISITPGAIGFRESAFVYAASVLGTTAEIGLSAAILDRLVVGVCNVVVAQAGFAFLSRQRKEPTTEVACTASFGDRTQTRSEPRKPLAP